MSEQNLKENLEPYSLQWFEKNIVVLENKEEKLLFENNRSKVQISPLTPNSYCVVDWSIHHEKYDIQVIFSLEEKILNNHYIIFIYTSDKKKILMTGYKSHTVYPPVWERSFSLGPDYYDYIAIQNFINTMLKSQNLPELQIDTNYEGKFVNLTKETPEEIKKLLSENKSYSILSVRAEAFFLNSTMESITKINL